jgi:hypothetical protein
VQQTERTSGTLGGRRVEQKPSEAPRLDRIRGTTPPKGNIFARPFESVKTKMGRTARSLDNQTGNLLIALKREPDGRLGMQNVLGAMKTDRKSVV